MKRVHLFLLTVILVAIAGKVKFSPAQQTQLAALSTETNLQDVEYFFKYKVNHIQSKENYNVRSCMVKTLVYCHT